jgi:hypothetical protein
MLNQEAGQTNVPRKVAQALGHRTKHESRMSFLQSSR